MPPETPIWEIEPHTRAKHQILRKYWQAWLPIMSRWNGRVLYIDGFAGPGEYSLGESGSPMIALDEAIQHRTSIGSEVIFLFIEDNWDRAEHLRALLGERSIPPNFRCQVVNSRFDETITEVLDQVDAARRGLAPTFALIDPFGYSHTPIDVIRRLMSNSRCEVLITFMYQFINRFVSLENQWVHLDRLYGTPDWREAIDLESPNARLSTLHGVYKRQLEQYARAKYVLPFKMEDAEGKTEYFLFFCTNNLTGLSKMKDSMYRVDPSGSFSYSYADNTNQLRLFAREPDFPLLSNQITNEFIGKVVKVEDIEEFVLARTSFLSSHYKKQVLDPLERAGQIEVMSSSRKRRYAYPKGTVIRFNA